MSLYAAFPIFPVSCRHRPAAGCDPPSLLVSKLNLKQGSRTRTSMPKFPRSVLRQRIKDFVGTLLVVLGVLCAVAILAYLLSEVLGNL